MSGVQTCKSAKKRAKLLSVKQVCFRANLGKPRSILYGALCAGCQQAGNTLIYCVVQIHNGHCWWLLPAERDGVIHCEDSDPEPAWVLANTEQHTRPCVGSWQGRGHLDSCWTQLHFVNDTTRMMLVGFRLENDGSRCGMDSRARERASHRCFRWRGHIPIWCHRYCAYELANHAQRCWWESYSICIDMI